MRLSEFYVLMNDEFGEEYAQVLLRDLALTEFSDRTGLVAIAQGENPKAVWLAICKVQSVPESRWTGLNKKPTNGHAD